MLNYPTLYVDSLDHYKHVLTAPARCSQYKISHVHDVLQDYDREFSICTTDSSCDGKTSNVASSPQRLSCPLRVVESGLSTDDKVDACAHDSKRQFNRPRFVRRANRKLHNSRGPWTIIAKTKLCCVFKLVSIPCLVFYSQLQRTIKVKHVNSADNLKL